MCAEVIASHSMLHALPNEILTLIFDHLFDDQRQQAELDNDVREYDLPTTYSTLYALARTCRSLSHVARDILRQKCVWEFRHPVGPFAQRAQTERYHGKYPECRHIEVLSDARWDGRSFYDGLAEEELKAALTTQGDWPENVWEILEKDPAQVQLALLVARSPSLRKFIMGALHIETVPDELPIWLYPIIQGVQSNLVNATHDPVYGNLQIIDIDMQNVITPLVGYLFALPSLQMVRLNAMTDSYKLAEEIINWPVQKRSSSVSSLILYDVDIPSTCMKLMITSCKQLSRFEYAGPKYHGPTYILPNIMSSLEQQQDSLRVLHLAPKDDDCWDEPDVSHARVDGFHRLHALENLSTSFQVLLGTPPMNYTGEGNWKYPRMRDILPQMLQELFLSTTATMVSHNYHDGYYDLFNSALPLQANGLSLKKIRVAYSDMITGAHSLPFSFWDIKNSYVAHGVKFDYSISISADRYGT